jgi:hypothetical protein
MELAIAADGRNWPSVLCGNWKCSGRVADYWLNEGS